MTTTETHDDAVELEAHANWRAGDVGNTDDWTLHLTSAPDRFQRVGAMGHRGTRRTRA